MGCVERRVLGVANWGEKSAKPLPFITYWSSRIILLPDFIAQLLGDCLGTTFDGNTYSNLSLSYCVMCP